MKRANEDATKETKKKSLGKDPDCLPTSQPLTCLEDLSNEVFYEICEYLDPLHIHQAFSDLNQRFSTLLTSSTLLLKLNLTSLSKSDFQNYAVRIIPPHQHQFISLRVTNFFIYEHDLSPHRRLPTFPRLETLILEHVHSVYVDSIVDSLACLPNLSTLVLAVDDGVHNGTDILRHIFRLPALKYCQLNFFDRTPFDTLALASDKHSCIEQLVFKHAADFYQLDRILSYVPQLRRLSLSFSMRIRGKHELGQSIQLKHLTHLFLKLGSVRFDEFERLVQLPFSTTEILHVSASDDVRYLEARRWQQLITSSLPRLRIFDLHVSGPSRTNDDSPLTNFNSSFWTERQWYFTHEDCHARNSPYPINLFSVSPYRYAYNDLSACARRIVSFSMFLDVKSMS